MGRTHRPELTVSPKQLVFLTMIAVFAVVVAFLCGVQVGRGLPAPAAVGAGWPAVVPAAAAGGVAGVRDLPRGATAPRLGGLSYFERLRGARPVTEHLDLAAPARRPAGGGAPAPPGPFAGGPAGAFVVQVMSVRGAAAARDVEADLAAKGYPVVVEPMPGIPGSLHRVGVGPFADRVEAERVSLRLRTEERFEPWVTRASAPWDGAPSGGGADSPAGRSGAEHTGGRRRAGGP